jgi:uroporphyrinogen-III synthase
MLQAAAPGRYNAAMTAPLQGQRILVGESRELDLFVRMLEAQGAFCIRCPLVTIADLADSTAAEDWLGRLTAGRFDDLILLTGEGLRRLLAIARRLGTERAVIEALAKLRTITRGPKPARALREIGLAPDLPAATPTTEGVIEALAGEALAGRRVGVQLYPDAPDDSLIEFLRRAGAAPDPVLPYRYASDAETGRVAAAIRDMAAGEFDFVAFTSTPQLRRLQEVARQRGLEAELQRGLSRTRLAAVGPVVAAALEASGAKVAAVPESSFHLKPLVAAMAAALGAAAPG